MLLTPTMVLVLAALPLLWLAAQSGEGGISLPGSGCDEDDGPLDEDDELWRGP